MLLFFGASNYTEPESEVFMHVYALTWNICPNSKRKKNAGKMTNFSTRPTLVLIISNRSMPETNGVLIRTN